MNKMSGLSVIFLLLIVTPIRAEWTGTVAEQMITYEQPPGDGLDVRIASFCAAPNGHLYGRRNHLERYGGRRYDQRR
jgi:hypothetical protein